MSTKLKITVTKEILEKSAYCGVDSSECEDANPFHQLNTHCAIALAVRDIFPSAIVEEKGIFMSKKSFDENFHHGQPDITLPVRATDFINNFDTASPEERMEMKPISFHVHVPERVIDTINIEEIRPLLVNHPNLEFLN